MDFGIRSSADVQRLNGSGCSSAARSTSGNALADHKAEFKGQTALIGFAGSPWTFLNFMMEGGSAEHYAKARHLFYTDRGLFDQLWRN